MTAVHFSSARWTVFFLLVKVLLRKGKLYEIIKSQKNTGETKRQNYVQRNNESINYAMLFLSMKPQRLDEWNKVLINVSRN
jgi:hypothetical protein